MTVLTVATSSGGRIQDLASGEAPGPLSRFHTELTDDCTNCHSPDGEADSTRCLACHTEMSRRIGAGKGFHRDKDEVCFACHVEHQGEEAELVAWNPETFDHTETGFELSGHHRAIEDCRRCHASHLSLPERPGRSYLLQDSRCAACHTDAHARSFGEDCSVCHTFEVRFEDTRFDHDSTRFSLTGAHVRVGCETCHSMLTAAVRDDRLNETHRCGMCHRSTHSERMNVCTHCHNTEDWRVRGW